MPNQPAPKPETKPEVAQEQQQEQADDLYVVLPQTMWHYSRGDLISASILPHPVEEYIKQGSLKKATAEDQKHGSAANPEKLPEYIDPSRVYAIPLEALEAQRKNERLAPPLKPEKE